MVQSNSSLSKKVHEAIALRKFGSLDLQYVTPAQAAALQSQHLLSAEDIVILANHWLDQGLDNDSQELAVIALNKPTDLSEIGPSFDAALKEMNIANPLREEAALTMMEVYLDAIIENRMPAMVGMAALDNLHFDHFGNESKPPLEPLIRHPKRALDDNENYLGRELGLEYLYTWYREFQDAQDNDDSTWYYNELPLDQQLVKFDEELIAEAAVLYNHLCSVHPEIFKKPKG